MPETAPAAQPPAATLARGRRAWALAAGVVAAAAVIVGVVVGRSGPTAAPLPATAAAPAAATAAATSATSMPVHSSGVASTAPAGVSPAAPTPDPGPTTAAAAPDPGTAGSRAGRPGPHSGSDARTGQAPGARPERPERPDRPGARHRPPGTGAPVHADTGPAPAPGTVKISVSPWARVTVAGSSASCAETPCVLELPAGKHTLRLVNPVAGLTKDRVIELEPGETLVVRETLSP